MEDDLLKQLSDELELAKKEKGLTKDSGKSNELLENILSDNKYGFLHGSHNSHGDWSKHWAHGGYEDDEPMDSPTPNPK